MNSRLTITILVAVLLAGIVVLVNQQEYVPGSKTTGSGGRDAFVEDMRLSIMDSTGQPVYRLTAIGMTHQAGTDVLHLQQPRVNISRPNGNQWNIMAARGEAAANGERVWLPGRVELERTADSPRGAMQISASDVLLKPEEKLLETPRRVVITTDNFHLEAIGLDADLSKNRLELRTRVRGTIHGAS